VSRIQDILAKAERDGTARRTQATPSFVAAPPAAAVASVAPAIDGTSALAPAPFMPALVADPEPTPVDTLVATPPADARTAQPLLHPALVTAIQPHSPVAERYRAIRTRVMQHEETQSLRTIMVTSPGAGDGKSITAANLAIAMAQEFQRRVVLVDADFRHPSIQSLFGIEAGPGLAGVLAGEATLDDALIHLPDFRLTILPAGPVPEFPTELLGSTAMRRTLDTLRARFDRVLLDLPAVMPLADVGTIAPLADGVVMVVRAGVTQRPALDRALAALEETKVLGVVLNEVR
jgi:capsular exopolysaccharide synthesis family protein